MELVTFEENQGIKGLQVFSKDLKLSGKDAFLYLKRKGFPRETFWELYYEANKGKWHEAKRNRRPARTVKEERQA
jgi:hypothetical protein